MQTNFQRIQKFPESGRHNGKKTMVLMLIKPLKHFSYINSVLSKFIKIKANAYFSMAPFVPQRYRKRKHDLTHGNNSSANCLTVFDHFLGLSLEGLIQLNPS